MVAALRRLSLTYRLVLMIGLAVIVGLVLIAISYALAIVIRFALSRRREFLADAGSVELTKNPDAMISALRKISGHATLPNDTAHMAM